VKGFDYKKILPKAIVVLLCAFLVGGIVWGIDSVLRMEGTLKPYSAAGSLSAYPAGRAAVIDYINSAIEKAVAEKPELVSSVSCDINKESLSTGKQALVLSAAEYVSSEIGNRLEDSTGLISSDYGEDISKKLPALKISLQDILACECSFVYYVCPVCGEENEACLSECPVCGGKKSFEKRYRNDYTVTVKLKNGSGSVTDNFPLKNSADIGKIFRDNSGGFYRCGNPRQLRRNAVITAVINRLTDKIQSLSYKTDTDISLQLIFSGAYRFMGTVPANFTVSEEYKTSFTWPGIEFSEKELSMNRKSSQLLKAAVTCADPAAAVVNWKVSDDSVASVDSDGYIKCHQKNGSVKVTASFEFQGKTYSDTCIVHVKTSVEGIRISKRKLRLGIGESCLLKARVKPKKATIQSVKWFSENEKIAAVDKNGKVTAIGRGETGIYAVSDDGYFKASCKVEVT